jgi:hypothetical protein
MGLPNGSTSESQSQEEPQRAGSNSPRTENFGEDWYMEVLGLAACQNPAVGQ